MAEKKRLTKINFEYSVGLKSTAKLVQEITKDSKDFAFTVETIHKRKEFRNWFDNFKICVTV